MKQFDSDFMTNIEEACMKLKGLGDTISYISDSQDLGELNSMLFLFAGICHELSAMIDISNYKIEE